MRVGRAAGSLEHGGGRAGPMITWLKAIHIAGLVTWCGGLLILPSLFALRPFVDSDEGLFRLQRLIRAAFVVVISPAAFVAIGAGTVLIFLREVFTTWMALKLVGVGVLAGLHIRDGYIILHLFDPGRGYARWRQLLATMTTLAAIAAVLLLVLGKPQIVVPPLPDWLQPGGLHSLIETMIPIP